MLEFFAHARTEAAGGSPQMEAPTGGLDPRIKRRILTRSLNVQNRAQHSTFPDCSLKHQEKGFEGPDWGTSHPIHPKH